MNEKKTSGQENPEQTKGKREHKALPKLRVLSNREMKDVAGGVELDVRKATNHGGTLKTSITFMAC